MGYLKFFSKGQNEERVKKSEISGIKNFFSHISLGDKLNRSRDFFNDVIVNTISFFFSNVLVELNTERKKFGFEELTCI